MPTVRTSDLARLMQRLPQELYDRIYDLTFTAEKGVRRISHTNIRPYAVKLLRIDRASRQLFAHSYYGDEGATFEFDCYDSWRQWAQRVDKAHRGLIKDARLVECYPADRHQDANSLGKIKMWCMLWFDKELANKFHLVTSEEDRGRSGFRRRLSCSAL